MAQGNPNKVNAIVDEIVENNNVFKLKSSIEQDKEKDSIAQSINSAISVLNEVGKELVLQELSVDPDEKFKGFIDSVGNVDISGLSQMTATIVKEKIIEAEKEGIDLRQGQPVFKDNTKALLVGGVLTVAVIDTMIKNYDNLSSKERQSLFNQWGDLSQEQKDIIYESTHKKINNSNLNNKDKKILDTALDIVSETDKATLELPEDEKFIADYLKIYPTDTQEIINFKKQLSEEGNQLTPQEKIYRIKQFESSIYGKLMASIDECASNNEITPINRNLIRHTTSNLIAIMENQLLILEYNLKSGLITQDEYNNMLQDLNSRKQQAQNKVNVIKSLNENIEQKRADRKAFSEDTYDNVTTEEAKNIINYNIEDITTSNVKEKIGKIISKKIEQLPSALAKANFSQEDILEAMKQYRDYISNYSEISEVVADNIKKLDSDDIVLNIQDDFNSLNGDGQINSNVHKILNILAQVNYGSSMQQILTNLEVREQFLAQFDKVIEQGINLEQDVKLDGELAQIFSQYFKDNAEEMDISAIEEQKEQVTDEQVKQEDPKEMYSFIDSEYLKQDSIEGLIPRNGENSQSLQDDKKAIFYSHGKEGAIVMYFEFLKQYERLRGSAGDKALEQYANYKNGTIELSDEQVQLLQGQLKQITQMRETKDFDEFMGDKLYLKLNGIDIEQDRQAAEEWRASHPGTRMDYNYANSWTNSAISPDRIDVVSLQSKDGKDVRTSQKDLIKYFLSQTSIDKIEELGVNDTTLENIRKYYQEHSAEIAQMGEEYSVVTQNIQEFEQSRESKEAEKQSETRETEITAPEIEKHEENLPAKQDNSFLGKIKRVFANMKDMKNKDNSKGFFARLGASIQTVFGNKKDEFDEKQDENITLNSTQRKEQTREDSKQTNYLTQHFDVNEKQAVQDLKKKQDSKDKDSQLSQDDQEFGNL